MVKSSVKKRPRKKLSPIQKRKLHHNYHQEAVMPVTGLNQYLIFLYGEPKVGKSTFASEFSNVFFIKCEPGHKLLNIKGFPGPDDREDYIKDWTTFTHIVEDFEKMGSDLDADIICIDTVDPLYRLCVRYICKQFGVEHVADVKWGRAWEALSREWEEKILRISNLGKGVIFIGHSTEKEVEIDGLKVDGTMPSLQKRGFNVINSIVDYLLCVKTKTRRIKTKGGKTKNVSKRVLITKASETVECGERSGKLPQEIPFSYKDFEAAVLATQQGE